MGATYRGFHWRPLAGAGTAVVLCGAFMSAVAISISFGILDWTLFPLSFACAFAALAYLNVEHQAVWSFDDEGIRESALASSKLLRWLKGRDRFIPWDRVKKFGFLGDGVVAPLMIRVDLHRGLPLIIIAPANVEQFQAFDEFAFDLNEALRAKTKALLLPDSLPYRWQLLTMLTVLAAAAVALGRADTLVFGGMLLAVGMAWLGFGFWRRVRNEPGR
jgi:hypothetical protein